MAKYKLLAGMHVQADRSRPVLDAQGKPTGRFESRSYRAGETFESDADLVAKLGPQHVELIGGDVAKANDRIAELERELAQVKAEKQVAQTGEQFRTPGDPTPENLLGSPAKFPGGQVSTGFQGGPPSGESKAAVPPSGDDEDDLDSMTVKELEALATDEEIDLGGASKKADIIAAIRAAR